MLFIDKRESNFKWKYRNSRAVQFGGGMVPWGRSVAAFAQVTHLLVFLPVSTLNISIYQEYIKTSNGGNIFFLKFIIGITADVKLNADWHFN